MKSETQKKALAISGAIVIAAAGIGVGAYAFPHTITVEKQVEKIVQVPGPTHVETVEVPVEHNITIEVPVDNGKLDLVLKELVKKNGNVEYLTDGLDESEIAMIVDRLELAQDWEHSGYVETRSRLAEELHKEEVGSVTLYREDIKSIFVDEEEISFDHLDYEAKDVDVIVPFRFRQDDVKYEGTARVVIIDGKYDDFAVDDVHVAE